jgi:hypothetical protein
MSIWIVVDVVVIGLQIYTITRLDEVRTQVIREMAERNSVHADVMDLRFTQLENRLVSTFDRMEKRLDK